MVDDAGRLNERNRRHLRLALPAAVINAGYDSGIRVESGKRYDFSVWARTDQVSTPLTVAVTDPAGTRLADPLRLTVRGTGWTRYTGTLTARTSSITGRLLVSGGGTGTLALDMVSLFPRDTYRGRPNGLRRDLAEKIAALRPGFVRFPGGCLVNTGSHRGYEAPDWERRRSYQWKDTTGPVEQRATNANFWGYNQFYGLGCYEYFQFAEDIGAMPLPVVPALVTGCGQNQATDDPALLARHIRDTLDLIEFANGPADSPWGRERAEMGHPAPFGLTHLAVGNEENLPGQYFARFTRFRDAIAARYPDITVIGNSGPDDAGGTFDRLWQLNREAGVAVVDEHHYNSPTWFLQNNERYDRYDRQGSKVFLGEYASQDNRFFNALSEAAYLSGLERNAGVVPSTATGTPSTEDLPITGAVGLSSWGTAASYDEVVVTAPDGTRLFADDFSGTAANWTGIAGRGTWALSGGAYVQSDTAAENTMVTAGDPAWRDYDLNVRATKLSGREGFLVAFGVRDSGTFYWWNLGGWDNTGSAVEKAEGGGTSTLVADGTTVEPGRTYDLRVSVRGRTVSLFLDGRKWGEFNAPADAARATVDLKGAPVEPGARVTTLLGDPDDVNTRYTTPIAPRESRLDVASTFTHTFPPYSVTFLRIKVRSS